MSHPIAHARIKWLAPDQGGRQRPPTGPVYATTAHFGDLNELFSVLLRFEAATENGQNLGEAELTLLAPENLPDIVGRLVAGCHLFITEGPRTVAEACVLSVREQPGNAAPPFASASNR